MWAYTSYFAKGVKALPDNLQEAIAVAKEAVKLKLVHVNRIICTEAWNYCHGLNCCNSEERNVSFEENKESKCNDDFYECDSEIEYATESDSNAPISHVFCLDLHYFNGETSVSEVIF